jgi:hypothetical protein
MAGRRFEQKEAKGAKGEKARQRLAEVPGEVQLGDFQFSGRSNLEEGIRAEALRR